MKPASAHEAFRTIHPRPEGWEFPCEIIKNSQLLTVKATNHCILIDDSGGRGISPNIWNPPQTSKYVGFAGGLGPDNLAAELTKIQTIAGTGSWVDMEGKLRTHDLFDLDKAEACINIFRDYW